jgi:chromosome segregation ATPase
MDHSQNSSFSSGQYGALVRTVTELRAELEKTLSKIQSLQDQNQQLNSNYLVVEGELNETKRKYNEIREGYLNAVKEKLDVEKAQEGLVTRLRAEIVEKTKEFENIREKLIPHDIDQLRIKVEEELEIRHKQELKSMEMEVEIHREKFYAIQREMERMKIEYANMINLLNTENKALREEKDVLQNNWRTETLSFFATDMNPDKDDRIRQQTTKIHELSHSLEIFREELKTVRKERDLMKFEMEQQKSKSDMAITTLKMELARIEAEKAGCMEKIQILTNDNERKDTIARSSKAASEESLRMREQAEKEKQDLERYLENLRQDCDQQVDSLREDHSQEVRNLRDQISNLHNKLVEREEYSRRIQREASEMQLRAESMEAEMRRSHHVSLQELKKRHSIVELELADARQICKSYEEQLETIKEQYILEKDTVSSELSRVRREKDVLHGKLREYEANLDNQRKKSLQAQQDQLNKISMLEKQLRDLQASHTSLQIKLDTNQSKYVELEKQKQSIEDVKNQLHSDYLLVQSKVDSVKRDFQHQMEVQVKAKLMEMKKQFKHSIAKEKKRADLYKTKATEAHQQIRTLAALGADEDA